MWPASRRTAARTRRRLLPASATPSRVSRRKVNGRAAPVLFLRIRNMRFVVLLATWMVCLAAAAQSPHRDLYLYRGTDRDQRLLAGAQKEKRAVVYTSLNLKDSLPIVQAFERKYGVKIELWRS